MRKIKKILLLGSGALKIGQAGEFDYSGSQAIKAYKEEGIKTVLINPNIATIQTSDFLADEVYFLPVKEHFIEEVIKKERPDAIALSFGGQTALNCGVNLYKQGIFKKYKVEVLGTSVPSIVISEDRDKFAQHLHKIGVDTPKSHAAKNIKRAREIAAELGFPLMVRAAFALGGQKSGVARTMVEFEQIVKTAFSFSPQVLIEEYLHHWKEVEYEIVRDQYDNCVTVCNMENMDPLGIHTGESIVVAPSQTLTNYEYQYLRDISIKIVRSLNIIGECNVQFALNPRPKSMKSDEGFTIDYKVIELNPRLSRSSALASKATGYPLAYVAAKIGLGKGMTEIENQVTRVTQSCFEPALDYLVVKVPRWDLEKFRGVEEKIGSSMKSVGEVMSIGRSFEEAIQKAMRMLDIGVDGVTANSLPPDNAKLEYLLKTPTPKRIFAIAEALKRKYTIEKIHKMTGIDPWFLHKIHAIVDAESALLKEKKLTKDLCLLLKQHGVADVRIAHLFNDKELAVRKKRTSWGIRPAILQIDTLAGEFPAQTNYLYTTYHATFSDVTSVGNKGVVVLGSGPYRIGSSVEFDWTSVSTALALKKHGKHSIIVNCNPETVSTDYDMSERLYFEELTAERIADIYDFEQSLGVIVSVGGQTPNNLVQSLVAHDVPILGTDPVNIDTAEDRNKFSDLLDRLSISQPAWDKFATVEGAKKFAEKVGYPVLIRPSYVLSGSAMSVCYDEQELMLYLERAQVLKGNASITVSKFFMGAKEIECDGVAQDGTVMALAISEHVENAGVHSGDATIVFPPERMYIKTERKVREIAHALASALQITGPFNIQFLAKENKVSVIEMNVRASRTFPFISKATGINLAELVVDAIFRKARLTHIEYPEFVLTKVPQFSFSRLEGADPFLHVEMASTGEAACFGETLEESYLKAIFSTGNDIRKKNVLLSIGGIVNKKRILSAAQLLIDHGYRIYSTERTHKFFKQAGIKSTFVHKVYEGKRPHVADVVNDHRVALVVNISDPNEGEGRSFTKTLEDGFEVRRAAIDNNIPLFTDIRSAELFITAFLKNKDLPIEPWSYYMHR